MTDPKTKAIIFAHHPYSLHELWGMSLTEKLIRQLSSRGIEECIVIMQGDERVETHLRKDLRSWHSISIQTRQLGPNEVHTLLEVIEKDNANFLVFQGNSIIDERVIDLLIKKISEDQSVLVKSGEQSPLAFCINQQLIGKTDKGLSLDQLIVVLKPTVINTSEMDSYIGKMRRRQEPYLYQIDNNEVLKKAEKVAFASIYKGATDFITKYAWPLPTRLMVHLISPTNITPNQITYFSMVLSFGAIPLFFLGYFWPAWIMGTIMSFLDTLDGKLARLTLRTSEAGHWLDNASDTIYLWLWYAGIGWFFTNDLLDFHDINTVASWSLVGFFTIDKIITGLFKKLFGAQLHDFAPIDWHARVFIARRNPFLVVLLIGLLINDPVFGLHAMAVWQTLTFAFHMMRFVYLPLTGQKHQVNLK